MKLPHGENYAKVRAGIRAKARAMARKWPHVQSYGMSYYKRSDYQSCFDSAFTHERRRMADEAARAAIGHCELCGEPAGEGNVCPACQESR